MNLKDILNTKYNFKSLQELEKVFATEQDCIDYLETLRWKGNVISLYDKNSKAYKCKNNRYKCKNSNKFGNIIQFYTKFFIHL